MKTSGKILRVQIETIIKQSFPRAQEIRPGLRATNQQLQGTVAQKKGQAQRSTGYTRIDAREYRLVVKTRNLTSSKRKFAGIMTKLTSILSCEYAISAVHR